MTAVSKNESAYFKKSSAETVKEINDLEGLLEDLSGMIRRISTCWTGEAGEVYNASLRDIHEEMAALIVKMQECCLMHGPGQDNDVRTRPEQ